MRYPTYREAHALGLVYLGAAVVYLVTCFVHYKAFEGVVVLCLTGLAMLHFTRSMCSVLIAGIVVSSLCVLARRGAQTKKMFRRYQEGMTGGADNGGEDPVDSGTGAPGEPGAEGATDTGAEDAPDSGTTPQPQQPSVPASTPAPSTASTTTVTVDNPTNAELKLEAIQARIDAIQESVYQLQRVEEAKSTA